MITQKTWGDVRVGDIVQDKNGRLHLVIGVASTITLAGTDLKVARLAARPPGTQIVNVYTPSKAEEADMAAPDMQHRTLREIEDRERTVARAALFRVDPIPRKAVALRDHIDWLHGVNVDDVLRRHNGTPTSPASKEAKKASVEELCQAHDEMHERPDLWPHSLPHHHSGG